MSLQTCYVKGSFWFIRKIHNLHDNQGFGVLLKNKTPIDFGISVSRGW